MNFLQNFANPRKDLMSFTLVGTGHFLMPSSLVGSLAISPGCTMMLCVDKHGDYLQRTLDFKSRPTTYQK